MTTDIDTAFTWYCDFLASQGMDVPDAFTDLSCTRQHILRGTAERQAARRNLTTPVKTLRERLAERMAS